MPDYFYHIGIELFDTDPSLDIGLSQTFRALNPFLFHKPRSSRDHRYDTDASSMRTKAPPVTHPTSVGDIPPSNSDDNRIDHLLVEAAHDITAGIGTKFAGAHTRGAFESTEENELGERGIIHLYRDTDETPGLYRRDERIPSTDLWNGGAQAKQQTPSRPAHPWKDEDCTTLAILAVPSYMTPRDFLAFVGQDTRNHVTHFRMIRTNRLNRYMVLMKFKDGRYARQWQHDWNTKLFNTMEPETCHVVFVKSVKVVHNEELRMARAGSLSTHASGSVPGRLVVGQMNKPVAPPTPSLVELPTCPVCLERMDECTGLITNLCQHVFHCTCLEKWSGYGCPVCRFKDDSFVTNIPRASKSKKHLNSRGEYEPDDCELDCYECRSSESLWQCLICGLVGCGRYAGKHAYLHYEQSGHAFALDIESQRVWDYDRDCYVHRIIANGSSNNEKLVELPGSRREGQTTALEDSDQDLDIAKRENLAFEYTQLLTSQLESQRMYFEDQVAKAVDNKTKAVQQADRGNKDVELIRTQLRDSVTARDTLQDRCDQLEKSVSRYESTSRKLDAECKRLRQQYDEMKIFSDTISENNKIKDTEATTKRNEMLTGQAQELRLLKEEIATKNFFLESLQEQVNDLRMQVAASKMLQEMVKKGELTQEEVDGSSLFAGPPRNKDRVSGSDKSIKSKKQGQDSTRPSPPVFSEPTDDDITRATLQTETSPILGMVAAMVKGYIHPTWVFTDKATETEIIKNGMDNRWLAHGRKGDMQFSENVSVNQVESYLLGVGLIELQSVVSMSQPIEDDSSRLGLLLETLLSNNFHVIPGKTGDDIVNALLQQGVVQPREEEGLYDSDDAVGDHTEHSGGVSAKSKSKKKKPKKKKK